MDYLKKLWFVLEGVYRYNFLSKRKVLAPRSLIINLTYKCNSRCVMCNIWQMRPKSELVYKDWVEVMKDPIFREVRNLTISGGEPSLFADYVLAVKLFVDTMPKLERLVINSNGFTTDILVKSMEEIARYCKRKGVKLVAGVSIDGVEDVHDSLRRIKGGFNKCAKTVSGYKKLAKKYGFRVTVSSLLLKKNISRYEEMVEWLRESKTEGSFQIVGFHDTYIKNMDSKAELDIDHNVQERFIKVLEIIRDSKETKGISRYYWEDMISMYKNGTNRTTPCPFLYDDFVVDSLGDVYYCLSVRPIGNFVKEKRTVGEIYYDSKNIEFRRNLPKKACKKCNSGCDVYRATAYDLKRYAKYKLTGKLGAETS